MQNILDILPAHCNMFLLLFYIPLVSSISVFVFFLITHPVDHLNLWRHRCVNTKNEKQEEKEEECTIETKCGLQCLEYLLYGRVF